MRTPSEKRSTGRRHLHAQHLLTELFQRNIDVLQIVILPPNKERNNHVEFIVVIQLVARSANQILGLLHVQFQRDCESQSGLLCGSVVRIVADFGEQLP